MDPVRGKNLDVQQANEQNPTASTTVTADRTARTQAIFARLGVHPEESLLPLAVVEPGRLLAIAEQLRADGFILFDIAGIDFSKFVHPKPARYGITYNFYNITTNDRVFLRAYVDDGETLPSLFGVWKAANYLEREVYDFFGVIFENHPNLRKILTPEDLEGHPLRKDYPLGETPTQFREGRFIDPPAFRAGLTGQSGGLTGWRGGERRGFQERPDTPPVTHGPKGGDPQ